MKIQNLAIIFIIIILPISLVLSSYTKNRVETISMQSKYDSKLNDATHDAIKAYQVNSFTSDTSYYANSKIRDIEASVNTFFNSLSSNFSSLGYTKDTLQNYVPAIVYTMYDGYYIYSPYINTWYKDPTKEDIKNEIDEQITGQTTYANGEKMYGLKPYVYYSCRYREDDENDVTITYSLDNYVQIQGKVGGNIVSRYGYLYSPANSSSDNNGLYVSNDKTTVKYNGVNIQEEIGNNRPKENVYVDGILERNLPYIKKNGTKFYLDNTDITKPVVFSVLKGKKQVQNANSVSQDDEIVKEINNNECAKKYYIEADELRKFIQGNDFLKELTTDDIVDIDTGKKYENDEENPYYSINGNNKIFDFDCTEGIESETSNFNTHRIDVIKNSIERNLSIAISNFNNYSNVTTDFQMPKLKDTDWDKIMNNISVISFFQGANIGGKVYNGYSVITNTMNEDVVMEDSIYIKKGNTIYDITDSYLQNSYNYDDTIGIFNINTEARKDDEGKIYYLPVTGTLSYNSIITKNSISNDYDGNLQKYVKDKLPNQLKQKYYTAFGRERYGLYRPKLEI